ncbi:ABC transporter permease subunit, partial [Clostridium perfringens]|uniref:ABC transporter permease subunit n=1 Tax=Clostridium perfringens TaxID=1502 RepID=UPI0038FCC4A8
SGKTIVFKHALRNSLIPVVTYLGPLVAGVLTGSFVVEKIFAIPGLGNEFTLSITNRDYTSLLGIKCLNKILVFDAPRAFAANTNSCCFN